MMMAHSVNYLSVLIAAVAAWLFGGVYYTALGKYWMAAQGKTMEQCQAEYAGKSGAAKAAPFIVVFVGELIMAWAMYGVCFTWACSRCAAAHLGGGAVARVCAAHDCRQLRFLRKEADAHRDRQRRLARRHGHHRRNRRLDGQIAGEQTRVTPP
jgi:hypothetical protein